MKKYKKLISLLLIIQLSITLVSCSRSLETSIEDSLGNKTAPNLPTNASSLDEFVPPDWEVLEQGEFDFNNDGYTDYVVVINSIYEKEYEADMGYDGKIYPRTLFVIFSNGENNYDLTYKNSDIISVDMHGLTCCGFNIPKIECSEKSFVITNFHGNNATSSYITDVNYFTYDDKEWRITKNTEKFHRTAFIHYDGAEVDDDGNLIIDINIPGIVEVEKDFETNLITHRDMLIKPNDVENEDTKYFTFEYEFFDHKNNKSTGFGSDFLTEFEDDTYKYFTFTHFNKFFDDGDAIPNISIKRLNKTNNTEEIIFEYYMKEKGENYKVHRYNGDLVFDYALGFVFLEGNKIIVRLEDKYDGVKKIYRVNLNGFTTEYIGWNGVYWL